MSELLDWAKTEIQLAIDKEQRNANQDEWNYGTECYKSALKAYESLLSDEHSGSSIEVTQSILNRLIDGNPLTPIEDTEDTWNLVSQKDGITTYQCSRMSSLFKCVKKCNSGDIVVTYKDIDACYCLEEGNDISFHSSLINRLYSEMFPITMPYMPPTAPDMAVCKEILTDPKNGDFDTVAFLYVQKPSGERIEVNRYFKEVETGWKEISKTEFDERARISITKN